MEVIRQLRIAVTLLIAFSLITGLVYPAMVTAIAQLIFPWQANGSLILKNDKAIASELIGQPFTDAKYFWSRPSATTPFPYNALASSGSNLGPLNDDLLSAVKQRMSTLQKMNPNNHEAIPVDLVTTSGSGLDPEISPYAAFYQIERVAKARGLSSDQIQKIVQAHVQSRTFAILGEPRVNVMQLNIALDEQGQGR